MQVQSLEDFLRFSSSGKIIITKARNSVPGTGKEIARLAEEYLSRKIPFDHSGTYDNDDAFFCTELIWKILEHDLKIAKLPMEASARKAFFYSMSPMYDSKYFDIKINKYQ